ncbi:MAG: response regulator [Flavobacteriaceae bacterium]
MSAGTRVLLVDDSPDTLGMLTDALKISGCDVSVATSGRDALASAETQLPDIVLMDAMMPGMDGFETCAILKNERDFGDVPVIFMTGFNESEHVVRAFAAGGVDFIPKPIPLDELLARIKVHLSNARKARSARKALDVTGRRIVACSTSGEIMWSTPQAASLLSRAGLHGDEGARLPWEVVGWLGEKGAGGAANEPPLRLKRNAACLEFAVLDRLADGEILLSLFDCHQGTREERLAAQFQLTLREAEVLLWITHGKSNKEIAEILKISPRTVNKHLEQIFTKLGIENRTAAATMAVRILWGD